MRRSTVLTAPLLVLALLAGCDQGSSGGFTNLGDRAKDDGGVSPTDGASGTPSDHATTQDHHGSGGTSCLKGSWEPADMSELGVDSIESMGGSFDFTLTFSGSTISVDLTESIPKTDYSEAMNMSFTAKGSYTASGDQITVSDWTASTKVNGVEQSTSDLGLNLDYMKASHSTFSCSGDSMTFDGSDFSRK